ncbi:hypothetical protein L6R50_09095 [Myxococcota bacterium]|nr:hypothetical protein [Myxococcota bacterium]
MNLMRLAGGALVGACLLLPPGCEEEAEPPEVEFLAPQDGSTVASGTVDVSLVIEHFTLVELEAALRARHAPSRLAQWADALLPGRAAYAHGGEEFPEGHCVLRLDGVEVATLTSTQGQVTGVEAGQHALEAELVYADGDPLDPPVKVQVGFTAEDGT